jgi:hypothetical protein
VMPKQNGRIAAWCVCQFCCGTGSDGRTFPTGPQFRVPKMVRNDDARQYLAIPMICREMTHMSQPPADIKSCRQTLEPANLGNSNRLSPRTAAADGMSLIHRRGPLCYRRSQPGAISGHGFGSAAVETPRAHAPEAIVTLGHSCVGVMMGLPGSSARQTNCHSSASDSWTEP